MTIKTTDILYNVEEEYDERIDTTMVDFQMVTNRIALAQGIRGEIKTQKGQCKGTGMENYGCDIWRILGQPLTPLIKEQASFYIKELEPKYEEIKKMTLVEMKITRDLGKLYIKIRVDSIYGDYVEDFIIG